MNKASIAIEILKKLENRIPSDSYSFDLDYSSEYSLKFVTFRYRNNREKETQPIYMRFIMNSDSTELVTQHLDEITKEINRHSHEKEDS